MQNKQTCKPKFCWTRLIGSFNSFYVIDYIKKFGLLVLFNFEIVTGDGFRLGFLGLLHMEVFWQRLQQEYDAQIVVTPPSVPYKGSLGIFVVEFYIPVIVLYFRARFPVVHPPGDVRCFQKPCGIFATARRYILCLIICCVFLVRTSTSCRNNKQSSFSEMCRIFAKTMLDFCTRVTVRRLVLSVLSELKGAQWCNLVMFLKRSLVHFLVVLMVACLCAVKYRSRKDRR